MPSDQVEFLTIEEAAALLRIGRTSAYALAREWRETGGRSGLPVVQLGRQLRVPRAVLADLHEASGGSGSANGAEVDGASKAAKLLGS